MTVYTDMTPIPVAPCANAPAQAPSPDNRTARIRLLNDRLRQTFTGGRVMMTAGVAALDDAERSRLFEQIRAFDQFDSDNDPYGEHDFGRVAIGDTDYLWKIDYYDSRFEHGSPDPANDAETQRVITVMRGDEY